MRDHKIVDNGDPPHWSHKHKLFQHALSFATVCPLLAAVVAPLSILLDIPALAETWYSQNGNPLPDPAASLALSAVSLAFSIAGDALLLVRFTVWEQYWRLATHISVLCWVVKWVIGLANLIVFGILSRNAPQFSYDEGFWCSVLAFITSTIVVFLLVFHWSFNFVRNADAYSRRVRRHGRHFMIHNLCFTFVIGVTAAIMFRIEGWSYLQSIYFSVVTFTTIGFGDFYPSTTASRILMFPLALVGIAELSALIGLLIGFFSNVHKERLARTRLKFERERRLAEEENSDPRTLEAEIEFLEELHRKRSWRDHALELAYSIGSFLTFWLVGAAIFSRTEGWAYGTGLYFVYVFFFAIGYGDVYLQSPAGRTIFVVYALLAVPVMTSFAVQTVAGVFSRISQTRLNKKKAKASWKDPSAWKPVEEETAEPTEKELVSHAEYVSTKRRELDEKFGRDRNVRGPARANSAKERQAQEAQKRNSSAGSGTVMAEVEKHEEKGADWLSNEEDKGLSAKDPANQQVYPPRNGIDETDSDDDAGSAHTEGEMEDEDRQLTMEMLDTAAELERIARRLLINNLPTGSAAQILLKADWHVQLQEMRAVLHEEAEEAADRQTERTDGHPLGIDQEKKKSMRERVDREADLVLMPLGDRETMDAIRRYRECFATMLVIGSRLSKLKGREQFLYERRKAPGDD